MEDLNYNMVMGAASNLVHHCYLVKKKVDGLGKNYSGKITTNPKI